MKIPDLPYFHLPDSLPEFLQNYGSEIMDLRSRWEESLIFWTHDSDVRRAPYTLMEQSFTHYVADHNAHPRILLVVGPNGGGKDTFVSRGLEMFGGGLVVRDTTRSRRVLPDGTSEVNSREYNFIDPTLFTERIHNDSYVYYTASPNKDLTYQTGRAILRSELERILREKSFAIILGGPATLRDLPHSLRSYFHDSSIVRSLYLLPPHYDEWVRRLVSRARLDPQQQIEVMRRLRDSVDMFSKLAHGALSVDLIAVNDTLENIYPLAGSVVQTLHI